MSKAPQRRPAATLSVVLGFQKLHELDDRSIGIVDAEDQLPGSAHDYLQGHAVRCVAGCRQFIVQLAAIPDFQTQAPKADTGKVAL